MPENGHVRFGGGPWEKGSYEYLACGLPYQNLRDMVQRLLERHHRMLKHTVVSVEAPGSSEATRTTVPDALTPLAAAAAAPRTRAQQVSMQRRAARSDRYTLIHELQAQGFSRRAIARQ